MRVRAASERQAVAAVCLPKAGLGKVSCRGQAFETSLKWKKFHGVAGKGEADTEGTNRHLFLASLGAWHL